MKVLLHSTYLVEIVCCAVFFLQLKAWSQVFSFLWFWKAFQWNFNYLFESTSEILTSMKLFPQDAIFPGGIFPKVISDFLTFSLCVELD